MANVCKQKPSPYLIGPKKEESVKTHFSPVLYLKDWISKNLFLVDADIMEGIYSSNFMFLGPAVDESIGTFIFINIDNETEHSQPIPSSSKDPIHPVFI